MKVAKVDWTPKKQLAEGTEDVVFRRSQDGPTIIKAHAAILASQSDKFYKEFFPPPAGQTFPFVLCDWSQSTECEVALKAFVKMLYGTGPRFASLSTKTLLGVHCLASHYQIPGLMKEMVEKIKIAHIPLSEIPSYLSFDHTRPSTFGSQERRQAVEASIEETLKSIPGKVRIIRVKIDLSCLKEHLARILPTGTNLDEVLDAYKKFLALKVCYFTRTVCGYFITGSINPIEKLNILLHKSLQVICGDTSVPQKFSPSPLVDQVKDIGPSNCNSSHFNRRCGTRTCCAHNST